MFAERGCGHGCLRCEWEGEGARELMESAGTECVLRHECAWRPACLPSECG